MPKYVVERDGQRDLRFEGELLCEVSDREHSGPRSTRWTEIAIYRRSATGGYVVAITNRTQWQGDGTPTGPRCVTPLGRSWMP